MAVAVSGSLGLSFLFNWFFPSVRFWFAPHIYAYQWRVLHSIIKSNVDPPVAVVVVPDPMDWNNAGLPPWPGSAYGILIEKLNAQGASFIGFDALLQEKPVLFQNALTSFANLEIGSGAGQQQDLERRFTNKHNVFLSYYLTRHLQGLPELGSAHEALLNHQRYRVVSSSEDSVGWIVRVLRQLTATAYYSSITIADDYIDTIRDLTLFSAGEGWRTWWQTNGYPASYLVARYKDDYYQPLPVVLASAYLHVQPELELAEGRCKRLSIGKTIVPTQPDGLALLSPRTPTI